LKLLLDENLSYRLVVDSVGLHAQADLEIWKFARDQGFTIVSKDNDLRQLSVLHGAPPKVVWLSVGNATTDTILGVLNESRSLIESFIGNAEESLLLLELPAGA
jgi:predicted nuclease of predicted toxin-antitoxin system